MYIFKRHNLSTLALLLAMAVVVACHRVPSVPSPTTTPTEEVTPSPAPPSETPYPSGEPMEEDAREALANWLGIPKQEIEVVGVDEVEWPDTSLGCPEPGMVYAQMIVPGYRIVMRVGDEVYEYHSGGGQGVLCGGEGNPLISAPSE